MSNLIDTAENTKLVYLFVNRFKWLHAVDNETSVGHPKEGQLYRAFKNIDTNSYRIMYPIDKTFQGVWIEKLKTKNDTYTSEIDEITIENILDFDINDQDLTSFEKWLNSSNKDLYQHASNIFKDNKQIKAGQRPTIDVVIDVLRTKDPELASVVSMTRDLSNINPPMYGAIGTVVSDLLSQPPAPMSFVDDFWIKVDKKLGAGANLSAAIHSLSIYGGPNRKTNFQEKDLLDAVKSLLHEIHRIRLHNIEE